MQLKRHFYLVISAIFPGIFGLASIVNAAEKPNILFIFADDQCFETIGALGHTDIETPHLDKLVKRGTTFTHAYNMGSWSGAVCVASRHMLNGGAFVWKAQEISSKLGSKNDRKRQDGNFAKDGLMWSQLMSQAGYTTYFTGKWHVKAKPEEIFDVTQNIRGGMPNQTEAGYNRPIDGQPDPWSPSDPKFEGFWKGGKHWSEIVGDDAVEFLGQAKADENPFFMYIAFNAPHDPRQSPQEYVDRYPLDRIALPENFMPEYPFKDAIDNRPGLRDERLAPFPRTENAVKVNRQEYYAIITHMDDQIGRVLDALEKSGQADNTWIFFSADHGLAVGRHGLMGKQNLFDHSMRVPFFVVGPDVEAGKKIDSKIYLQDVMPTSLELAGAKIPDHVQFKSIRPILDGEKKESYDAIYGGYLKSQRAIIKGDKKLLLYPNVPIALMFDTEKDPFELTDIFSENKALAQSMFRDFLKLQAETGDQLDLKPVFPELAAGE